MKNPKKELTPMGKRDMLTKTIAIAGAVLVWLPILVPAAISVIRFLIKRTSVFDYLLPARLFPLALLGGGLLLWAALRARSRRGTIGRNLFMAVIFLAGSRAFTNATGLALEEADLYNWRRVLFLAFISLYTLALWMIGLSGVPLVWDLFQRPRLENAARKPKGKDKKSA